MSTVAAFPSFVEELPITKAALLLRGRGYSEEVVAADKVAKTRELRLELVRRGASLHQLDADRLDRYWACLGLLERRLGHHPLVRQLRFELEALALLPPHTGE